MHQTQLPNFPTQLPSNVDVRDFDIGGGRFARVIMELDTEVKDGHFTLQAQAYQMDAQGNFVNAPLGYPSRTAKTPHTIIESALGDTVMLDNAWVRHTVAAGMTLDPVAMELPRVAGRPTEPGSEYGELCWDTEAQQAWRWQEGFADSTARAKIQDLLNVLNSSTVRSGLGFR